jgi:phage tail-like protein
MASSDDPFTTFNFLVYLTVENPSELGLGEPLCNSEFAECDGLEMTMETKTVREGGNNTQVIHLVGPVSYGNLVLKRGMTRNQDLWKWFTAAVASPAAPQVRRGALAGAEIIMRDGQGVGKVRYRLFDCLPIKLKGAPMNAKDGIVALEELQIAYSYFTIEAL